MPIPADSVSYTPLNSNITDKSFATFPDIKFPESLQEEVLYIINMFIIQFQEYKEMQNKILLAERILLQTLGFDLQLIHPYRACLDKIKDTLKCKNKLSLRRISQ